MRRKICLTFDNGPHEIGTPQVLEILAVREITACFFFVGESLKAQQGRALAERVRDAGHRIGNHTMTHGRPLGFRPGSATVQSEIIDMQTLLRGLTSERLFRPNGDKGRLGAHLLSQEAVDYLQHERYTVVTWNCLPADWVLPAGSWVERARASIASLEWSAIVLHDHRMAEHPEFLAGFLDELLEKNCQFTTDFPRDTVLIEQGTPTRALHGNYGIDAHRGTL